jgi:hypothetical protein
MSIVIGLLFGSLSNSIPYCRGYFYRRKLRAAVAQAETRRRRTSKRRHAGQTQGREKGLRWNNSATRSRPFRIIRFGRALRVEDSRLNSLDPRAGSS